MRPLRFLLLVFCFIAIPVLLTCISFFKGENDAADVFHNPQRSRLRALLSFSTPSSLFPPSAIISLTTENSTFFLARPAAFGPSLPSKGLSGQLWIGRGFGDDSLLSEDDLKISGFELGCSDVPGWGEDQQKTPDNPAVNEKAFKKINDESAAANRQDGQRSSNSERSEDGVEGRTPLTDQEDGTDDHLHRPLPDSNPAPAGKNGRLSAVSTKDKSRKPTHADIESLQESADITGKIVMLSRGGCGFLEKVKWTQRRGGVALIVGDNERNGPLAIMYAKGDTSNVTIPAIFTSYTSAHLLSSLVPPELGFTSTPEGSRAGANAGKAGIADAGKGNVKKQGPVFTTSTSGKAQPTSDLGEEKGQKSAENRGWMQKMLQAVLFDDSGIHEDSRRPPGMGNIEWIQVKDWDEEEEGKTTTSGAQISSTTKTMSSSSKGSKHQTTKKVGDDDFVIGVQDWRDTELIAPKSTSGTVAVDQKSKVQASSTTTGVDGKETNFKGGSIIPGSGEYVKPNKDDASHEDDSSKASNDAGNSRKCKFGWQKIKSWFSKSSNSAQQNSRSTSQKSNTHNKDKNHESDRDGLWVTLTPTSVSTSPFFDTLLVLVVSPLVTLTFVYGLLLLRSRIRRRRWRAPKSVVERLPVRTYHNASVTSSTTSSELPTPDRSHAASPQPRAESIRARQRSQTTDGVLTSSSPASQSPPVEKPGGKPKPKKYRGRQVECVVCLEEYVDGESKVMSLPCGHEFHAECITPWLVNRRRTCPICKGDVVRSLQRQNDDNCYNDEDNREPGEETADGVQDRAATTVAEAESSAIPIPERVEATNLMDEDVERGEEPLAEQDTVRPVASRWRGILNASVSNLSGDTLWRSDSVDRNR